MMAQGCSPRFSRNLAWLRQGHRAGVGKHTLYYVDPLRYKHSVSAMAPDRPMIPIAITQIRILRTPYKLARTAMTTLESHSAPPHSS